MAPNWRALVLTSGWTHSLGFHLFLFFQLADARFCLKCQEPLVFAEIIWVVFLFFFFIQVGEAQAVLAEAWLICGSSSVLCITFSFCTGYRISYTFFVCVDPAPRQHRREKRIREYKQHVSIWKMCFFAWGISLLISALLWSRWKYLNKYWMDYHEILHSV